MTERAVGRPWTTSEDQLLASAVAVHGQVDNWKAVALSVPGRTNKACRKRWLHSLSPNVKKTAWTREEDDLLLELYKIHSAKWAVIARNIPGRTDDACSKRYREALDPSLKKDDWTPDEDERLLAAYSRLGGRWGRVGQELQRSGLGCRNRWRLLQRKRATGASTSNFASSPPAQLCPPISSSVPSIWPSLPMIEPSHYWDDPLQVDTHPSVLPSTHATSRNSVDVLRDTPPPAQHAQLVPQLVDYPAPFHYSSSSLTSALSSQHAVRYEKDADRTASEGRQSLLLPTASVPPDSTSTAMFAPFDYDSSSSTCALSVSSTSPAPQATYTEDMHQGNIYDDRPHQFHQLHRSVPPTTIPVHGPSAHPVQVDHYTPSVAHEECSHSHAALSTRHQLTPPSSSLRAPSSADSYFATSQLPEQQAGHVSSSMTSVSLLDKPDTYYHPSPEPQLDVNAQHALLPSPDPLSLSESRPGYHYAHHQRGPSRARVVETLHGQEQHGDYHHNHVQPGQSRHGHPSSRPPTTSPPDIRYPLHQPDCHNANANARTQPEAGPSRTTPDHYYTSNPLHVSQLVRRSTASPRPVGMPYARRPSSDSLSTNAEDHDPHSLRPVPRKKIAATSSKRPDTHAPLRLSSDLQATSDPSVKPYACGHENCWPSDATSSRACYCTSRGLSDHNKSAHPVDSGGDRPYRCGLEGCGKSWKSINGLQYHLQISKAHFQHAITSSFVSSYISGLAVPASVEASTSGQGEDKTKKQYKCPHENCPNRYKQLSGLRYHLAHGHPVDLPKQLDLVPPALSRKLAEKMRVQGPVPSSPGCQVDNNLDASHHSTRGSFDS